MIMRPSHQLVTGLSFGVTSGVITTLGLMVGLLAGTHLKLAVIGGILTIAVADALSDVLGIHISEEAEGVHSAREVWTSTVHFFGEVHPCFDICCSRFAVSTLDRCYSRCNLGFTSSKCL